MQYLVIKWDDQTSREVGVNANGSTERAEDAEMWDSREVAQEIADRYDAKVMTEERFFGEDDEDED